MIGGPNPPKWWRVKDPMPRYFFDVHDGTFLRDEESVGLDSVDEARKQVWTTLPMLAAHREADGHLACQLRMDVRDEAGRGHHHQRADSELLLADIRNQIVSKVTHRRAA